MNITPLDPWIYQKINAGPRGLTRREIEAWQRLKLNVTLAHARNNSSFYRKHLAGMPETITHLRDFAQFPFTTPEDLRQGPLRFVCVSQDEIQRVVTLQSSGTTGAPKRLYFTAEDQELTIDFFGVGMCTLTQPDSRVLILLPGETPGSVGDLLRQGLLRQSRQPIVYGPVRDPQHALGVMHEQKIDCLVGSPTQVLGLARRWQPGRHKPTTVLLSTDYVPTAIVKTLEQVWGCKVYNHYGATEMGLGGGVECDAHAGYHLREADLYFEVIDPQTGMPVEDGQYGEVVISTLTRRGMPLLRYRMGDRSRFIPGGCACGTMLKRMEPVSGRYSGFISAGDAVLHLPDFDEALFPIPGLLNFSVSVAEDFGKPSLAIEVHMLTPVNISTQVREALESIPSMGNLELDVICRYNPDEAGSLIKRVIVDKRGFHA